MGYIIKITRPGYDVLDLTKERSNVSRGRTADYFLYAIGLTYLGGAKVQVVRYKESVQSSQTAEGVYGCLHEFSCLLEDLATIVKYTEKCHEYNKLNSVLKRLRNHIRHDIREAFDSEDNDMKEKTAKRLGIHTSLQTDIELSESSVRVGSTVLTIEQIEEYLHWAKGVMDKAIIQAQSKGRIR